MSSSQLLPEPGHIAWVELDPVRGSEQAGRRPALVLSHPSYHQRSGRCVVCPITSRIGDWPFNVLLPSGMATRGMVLVDQIRTIDRAGRMFAVIEAAPASVLLEVKGKLAALVGIDLAITGDVT